MAIYTKHPIGLIVGAAPEINRWPLEYKLTVSPVGSEIPYYWPTKKPLSAWLNTERGFNNTLKLNCLLHRPTSLWQVYKRYSTRILVAGEYPIGRNQKLRVLTAFSINMVMF